MKQNERDSDIYSVVTQTDNPLESLLRGAKSETSSLRQTLSFDQGLNMSVAQSLFRESETPRHSNNASGIDLTSTLINNYRGFSPNPSPETNYKIDIPSTMITQDENEVVLRLNLYP